MVRGHSRSYLFLPDRSKRSLANWISGSGLGRSLGGDVGLPNMYMNYNYWSGWLSSQDYAIDAIFTKHFLFYLTNYAFCYAWR